MAISTSRALFFPHSCTQFNFKTSTMVVFRRLSLIHLSDKGTPPPPLFTKLAKKWETGEGDGGGRR